MKKWKRILAVVIALCMSAGSIVHLAGTEEVYAAVEISGDYIYTGLTNNTIEIARYTGADTVLEIPGEIDGKKVVSIGISAFSECKGLTEVNIPNGVARIGDNAFNFCTGLTKVNIPESVESIEQYAFSQCENLQEIDIPGSVQHINMGAFGGCTRLHEIHISNGVMSIGSFAFEMCTGLQEIMIPSSVHHVEGSAFCECSSLQAVNVDAGNADYISEDGVLYNKSMTELVSYPGGKAETGAITLPSSVKTIGSGAFNGAELKAIDIPNGVSSIDSGAFALCSSLQEVSIPGSVLHIGGNAFNGCLALQTVNIASGVESIAGNAFMDCWKLTEITLPASVSSIAESTFDDCPKLTAIQVDTGNLNYTSEDGVLYSKDMEELVRCPAGRSKPLTIPLNVKKISDHAFRSCTGLQDINIPSGVAGIGKLAFEGCTNLQEITILDGAAGGIGDGAFSSSGIKQITLPASVGSIGEGVFTNCSSLSVIVVDDGNPYLKSKDGVLYSKDGTKLIRYPEGKKESGSFAVPSSVKSIAKEAFYSANLKEISIPNEVDDIGSYAFYNCAKLEKINIPNKVSMISNGIFSSCKNLKEINIPKTVSSIGEEAFCNCVSLREIHIPDGVKSIGNHAFAGCGNLTRVVIPDSVAVIEDGAFGLYGGYGGRVLKTVYYTGTKEQWDNIDIIFKWSGNVELVKADKVFGIAADSLSQEYVYRILVNGKAEIVKYQGTDTTVEIPSALDGKAVESIGKSAFEDCSQITEISIPDSASNIKSNAFSGCTSLTKVHVPVSISSIQDNAFSGCDSIQDVYYKGTEKQWNDITIGQEGNDTLLKAQIHCQEKPQTPEEIVLPETADTKQELEKLKDGDALALEKDFQQFLSDEQIDIIESCIYTWLAEINYAYQYAGDSDVKGRIMKKAGIDPDGDFASGREQAVTHISVWTKYGPKTLEITLDLGKPDGNGSLYPSYGEMHYEILEKRSLPSDIPKSGRIGKDSYADMGIFINSFAKSSEDSLHSTFHWQKLEDWMTANILADKTVSEIIGNKNGCFVNGTYIVYARPLSAYSKKVTIACPVDVHVYSMDGTEAGSIVNNEPKGGNENVQLDVDGDTKIVYLAGDDYYLNLCGTDTGTMKYEVEEIANEEVQRDVQFLELQLKKDMQYEGYVFRPLNIDSDLYALRTVGTTSKEVFYAAEDKNQQALSLFKRVEGLTLGQGSTSVDEGRTVQMSASVSPLDASNPDLRWSTNDESIAKVDSNGMVTAVGAGRATVTVSTKDGSFLKQFCIIDVAGKKSEPPVEPDIKPGDNPGTKPGGSTGTNSGSSTGTGGSTGSSSSPGGSTSAPGNDNPNNNNSDSASKPPLEQEPSIVSLSYVLQFNANGGTGLSRATMTLLAGDCPGIMPKAKRKGYTFDGWYTQQKGGTRISGDKPLEQAATLYARWTKVTAPAKAQAPALKSKKKGQIKVSLKKVTGAAGYQITYSTSKKFTYAKTAVVSSNVKTLTGLKAGRKYYVRVRAYKVDSTGSRIYGVYSKIKSVKAKS